MFFRTGNLAVHLWSGLTLMTSNFLKLARISKYTALRVSLKECTNFIRTRKVWFNYVWVPKKQSTGLRKHTTIFELNF